MTQEHELFFFLSLALSLSHSLSPLCLLSVCHVESAMKGQGIIHIMSNIKIDTSFVTIGERCLPSVGSRRLKRQIASAAQCVRDSDRMSIRQCSHSRRSSTRASQALEMDARRIGVRAGGVSSNQLGHGWSRIPLSGTSASG